jgi:hypothetical protein
VTRIKNLFSKRIVTLIALVAIAGSSLASMAALTGTLTVTSTFAGAQIVLTGNGTSGSATLFDANTPVAPGQTVYAALELKNEGNLAANFTYTPPIAITGPGNLKDNLLARVYNPTQWGLDHTGEIGGTCADGTLIGWEPQMAAAPWTSINISAFSLNVGDSRYLCYAASLPSNAVIDMDSTMQAVQSFLGQQ